MLDRRHLLAGLAAGTATITAASAAVALSSADVNADADLLALGRNLDERLAAWNAYLPTYRAAGNARDEAMHEHEASLRRAQATGGRAAWWREWERLTGEHEPVIVHGNALSEAVEVPAAKIMALTPRTLAGLAVQARAAAFAFEPLDEVALEDLDHPEATVRRLLASIAALAG